MNTREVVASAAAGAALAYMADPQGGRRRRALARDRFLRATRRTRRALGTVRRDLANRASGLAARFRQRLDDESVDDARLVERVRAAVGHACRHPRALEVEADDGAVTIRGPVLPGEAGPVLAGIWALGGVKTLASQLEVEESEDEPPALPGHGARAAGVSFDFFQRSWPPATQALVLSAGLTATGLCLAAYGRTEGRRSDAR